MEIRNDLKKYIVSDLHLEDMSPEDISDNDPLFGDSGLGLDSLDAVELVVLVQKRFDVLIKDMEEAKNAFASINSLAAFIREQRAKK